MTMKELKKIYKYDEVQDTFILDVQLEDYRDAYSEWDFSPFANRDLDDDLTEYLLECSMEISFRYKFKIRFHILNQERSSRREKRSMDGMFNYFEYEARKYKKRRMRVIRDTFSFLIIGSLLLLVGVILDGQIFNSLWMNVLSEGFFIGGWVMIWEMFSTLFFDINKVSKKIKHFNRLKDVDIEYDYTLI